MRRTLDARPDAMDVRDRRFCGSGAHIPAARALADYLRAPAPVLDQGSGGGSVGFGLATVASYLLRATRSPREADLVSPWMLQAMAARYDPWQREPDAGIEARSALKGWRAHGVCRESLWQGPLPESEPTLTRLRAEDAALRPLASYARVDARNLPELQAALSLRGILFATAWIHSGWFEPRADGTILPANERAGCHAFALVAYDLDGVWIQNSWGRQWARQGLAYVTYDDWLEHAADVWSVQLGAPVRRPLAMQRSCARLTECPSLYGELRAHVLCVDDDGRLREAGPYGNSKGDLEAIFRNDLPRVTGGWAQLRILIQATGGWCDEATALEHVRATLPAYLSRQIYPIALLWRRDFASRLRMLLALAAETPALAGRDRSPVSTRDDALERQVRELGGRQLWDQVKEGAQAATTRPGGAARLLAGHLAHLGGSEVAMELHAWAHGAGAILLAPLIELLTTSGPIRSGSFAGANGYGLKLASCGLSAAACSAEFFDANYAAAQARGSIGRLTVLRQPASAPKQWADGYGRSILQLIAHALEAEPRIPGVRDGAPLIGLDDGAGELEVDAGRVLSHLPELDEPAHGLLGVAETAPQYARLRRRPTPIS